MNCHHTRRQSTDTKSGNLVRELVIGKLQTAPTRKKKTIQASESADNDSEKIQADQQNFVEPVLSIPVMPVTFSLRNSKRAGLKLGTPIRHGQQIIASHICCKSSHNTVHLFLKGVMQ